MAVERIVQHKHCIHCGRAIPTDKQYCSDKCEADYSSIVKRKNLMLIINYAMIGIFILILIFLI